MPVFRLIAQPAALAVLVVLAACSGLQPSAEPPPTPAGNLGAPGTQPTVPPASPTAEPTPAPTPADLSPRPLVWFAPLPPMPGRTGSVDFMQQFEAGAPWRSAAGYVDVYKLYGEWVAYNATDEQLRQAVTDIDRRGMVLAVEAGPLDPPADCGQGVESFAGIDEGRLIARRIQQAGGRIAVIALDEPYFYGHVYDGANACQWDLQRIARGVAGYVEAMRSVFPELLVGDIEPVPQPVSAAGLAEWLAAYEAVSGEPFAFLDLDMDWSRPGWPGLAQQIGAEARARGVPIGMIYNGGSAPTRDAWIRLAGQRVLDFEAAGEPPDHVVFQSWMAQPDRVLPDDDQTSFSGLVRRYFEDHPELGSPPTGPGANIAFGRRARASSSLADSPPSGAVDGDFDTLWNSGAGPPGWIEITLDGPQQVAAIRLTVSQYPAGPTDHRVYGRTSGGDLVLLERFRQQTNDGTVLDLEPDTPWSAISAIRIETRAGPSWVAWREIEVIAP